MSVIDIAASYFMGILASSLCIVIIYFFRKRFFEFGVLSIKGMAFIYGLCVFRALVPLELPCAVAVKFQPLVPLADLLFFMPITCNGIEIYGWHVFLGLYSAAVLFFIIRLIIYYAKAAKLIKTAQIVSDDCTCAILKKVISENKHNIDVRLLTLSDIQGPMSTGIFKSVIILPENYNNIYSEKELYFILKHEYIHVTRNDAFSKLIINIASCFLFWNPCMLLLKKDYIQSIELNCDNEATSGFSSVLRSEYLDTMLTVLNNKTATYGSDSSYSPALNFVSNESVYLKERFVAICDPGYIQHQRKNKTIPIMAMALILCSYIFIFYAYYEPPIEDIIEGPDCYEIDFGKDYIVVSENGSATAFLKDGTQLSVEEDIVDWFIENKAKVIYQ